MLGEVSMVPKMNATWSHLVKKDGTNLYKTYMYKHMYVYKYLFKLGDMRIDKTTER